MAKPQQADESLFKGMPEHAKKLWAEHKKHKRTKQRAAFKLLRAK